MKEKAIQKLLNELRAYRRNLLRGKTFYENSPQLEYIKGLDLAINIAKFHLAVYKHTNE